MLHKELWQTDNEEWLKTREKEWLEIKSNLESIDFIPKKSFKGLRHFFIFGEVLADFEFPRMQNLKGDEISLFFKLWFLPKLDQSIIRLEIKNATFYESYNLTYDLMALAGERFTYELDGLMNGRERVICKTLFEDSFEKFCQRTIIRLSSDKYSRYALNFFGSFNSSIYRWLQEGYPVNNAYQWMIPVWKDCIQYLPEKSYGRKNRFLRWLMEVLSPDYHQPHFDTDDRYQKVATELREYILSDESPEALKEVWREVHQG